MTKHAIHIPRFLALLGTAVLVQSLPLMADETIKLDPKTAKVTFSIKNKPPGGSRFEDVPGSFKDFSGSIVFDDTDASKSSVAMEVKTASVDTANTRRDDHLRNQDFFKVKEFPSMTFKSSAVTKNDDGHYAVAGTFTLLGKSKEMTITFVPSGDRAGKTEFTIKRSDFGMDYRIPETGDEVAVTIAVGEGE
ncbi:MAG TPA: YceI family protein [Verrucomicrobiales bacterium]|nr:YceI family protein [Verrucomicrobiales bacterium]